MSIAHFIHGFWIGQIALESLLLLALVAKNVWRTFPLFTAFSIWSVLGDFGGYVLLRYPGSYAQFYLLYETVSVGLALAVTYEVFVHLLSAHRGLRRLATISLCVVTAFLIGLGLTVIFSHSPIGQKDLASAILTVEEAYRVLEVGLILSLFVFSSTFGLHWRRQVFGIVVGLGISASVKLVAITVIPKILAVAPTLNLVIIISCHLSLLIWIAYTVVPESISAQSEMPENSQLQQWNRAVMELIHQ